MTYLILNLTVLAVLALVTAPVLRQMRRGPLLLAAAVLITLTAVFDGQMIAAGLCVYDAALLAGPWIAGAPVEDFAYPIAAVLLMPALWTWLQGTGDAKSARGAGIRALTDASRPFSWVNTAYPFAAGYLLATGGRIDAMFIIGTLYFLIPYNLLMYGVNDVFDYASDLANPRKGGIEGALADPLRARVTHRQILVAAAVLNTLGLTWLLVNGSASANVTVGVVVFLVIAYSAPHLRFKERPIVDSVTSSAHFVGPLLYALVLTGQPLSSTHIWPILAAFFVWGVASHAFGAVQDVLADRQAGIGSIATVFGARWTSRAATIAYVGAAALLILLPWPGVLAAAAPIPYAISTARFWNIDDARSAEANRGWRTFLWLNLVTGFAVTMLLIAVARLG